MKRAEFKCQGDEAEVFLYGEIGDSWGEGISAKAFNADLVALSDVKLIIVRINSPGGDVFDTDAMYNALRRHSAEIHTIVDGVAASAASLIAMAGDTITMAENSRIMIHDPSSMISGTAADLRQRADLLESITESYVKIYLTKTTGKATREELEEWMAAETWFTGLEAVEAGLADEISEPLRIAASIIHPGRYKNTPTDLVCEDAPGLDPRGAWRLAAARRDLLLLG